MNVNNNLFLQSEVKYLLPLIKNKKVVFTNGCFDLLHYGHISLLNYAKNFGDILVVGLNSDSSIKRIKGNDRPIYNEIIRSNMLLSLKSVDYVVVFEDDTPRTLIEHIKPDVLVKGSEYLNNDVVGSDVVLKNGGEIVFFNQIEGISTTKLIKSIKSLKE